ncbi:MAG: RNA methyltransferase [Lachnospiraceae bacterium]|nr:RNA methyltransferase [Lachnospiraceae bacterium]
MITSTSNQRVKQIVQWQEKARARRQDGVFLAEGLKMYCEAPMDLVREVYLTESLLEQLKKRGQEKLERTGYELVTPEVFGRMSDTRTPQGILTVLQRPAYELGQLLQGERPLLVLLEDLQDPGNLGTILRTGEGAGITGVIMSKKTVDIYNPKTIRATMGSIYRVPFLYVEDLGETVGMLRERGIQVYAAHLQGQSYYNSFSFAGGTAFLIGNEGNGLRRETAEQADAYLKIPMEGQVESLNAAIAASLLVYEVHRQRNAETVCLDQQKCAP